MTIAHQVMDWALVVVGLAGVALCSGAEIGGYSLNRVRLHLAEPHDARARLLKAEIDRMDRLLLSLLVALNIFSELAVIGATSLTAAAGYTEWEIALVNIAILTPLTLILAEALPKEVFRLDADRLMYGLARPLRWWRKVLTWTGVLPVVLWFSRWVERVAGLSGKGESLGDARQRIALLLKEGASHAALSEAQNTLVDRALRLRQATVADEMRLWAHVRTIPSDWDRERLMAAAPAISHARVPVIDRRGRVTGVLRLIDLYTRPEEPIEALLAQPPRLSEDQSVLEALDAVRRSGSGIGIVEKDGRPVGLVTARDLVEPITGELADW